MKAEKIITYRETTDIEIEGIALLSMGDFASNVKFIPNIDCEYWLSSSVVNCPGYVSAVNRNGLICSSGFIAATKLGVRPVLSIQGKGLNPGDKIIVAGYTWTVLNNTAKMLCDTHIERRPYKEEYQKKEGIEYDKSDIKLFLEQWAKDKGILTA